MEKVKYGECNNCKTFRKLTNNYGLCYSCYGRYRRNILKVRHQANYEKTAKGRETKNKYRRSDKGRLSRRIENRKYRAKQRRKKMENVEEFKKHWNEQKKKYKKIVKKSKKMNAEEFFAKMGEFFDEPFDGKKPFRRLWQRIKRAIKYGMHAAMVFFSLKIKPEVTQFVMDNMHLAMTVVIDIAKDCLNNPGRSSSWKREMAGEAIREVLPDVKVRSWWIGLLIEIAVAVLKSNGVI